MELLSSMHAIVDTDCRFGSLPLKSQYLETESDVRKAGLCKRQQPEKMGDSSLKNHLHLSTGRGCYEGIFTEGRVKENRGSCGPC